MADILEFAQHVDARGALVSAECGAKWAVPFKVRRVFWIVGPRGQRGGHAHKSCEQVIIAVAGSCSAIVDGVKRRLYEPAMGLYIPTGANVSLEDFALGTVLLVLCSEHYDAEDYILPPACGEGCHYCTTATGGEVSSCAC